MNKKRIIVFCLFFIVFVIIFLFPYKEENKNSSLLNDTGILGEIKKEDNTIQYFESNKSYNKIGFRFANYQKIIKKGYLKITINDLKKNKKKIIKQKMNGLLDNELFYIDYKIVKNTKYSIEIKNYSDYAITLYTTNDKDSKTKLYLNNEYINEDLILYFKNYKKRQTYLWYFSFALTIYLIILVLNVGDKK